MLPFRRFLLFLVCLAECSAAVAGNQSNGFDIHFKLLCGSLILVPVTVNGSGPYDFVLDTACVSAALSSWASWGATRTATGSAMSAAPRESSSSWQSASADGVRSAIYLMGSAIRVRQA